MAEFGANENSKLLSAITEAEADDSEDKLEQEGDMNKSSDGAASRDDEASDEIIETYSESNSTAISHNVNKDSGPSHGSQFVKAEPLSAKQQVALWLTRTSTQEIYNELKMSNIKNWVYPTTGETRRQKHPLCGPSTMHNQIHRNFSTKSLLEGSYCPPHRDCNPMRKCETVLALSDEPSQKKNHFHKSKSKVSLCASRISFFKRSGSKCSSEILPSSSLHPNTFPGIRPTNRLRSKSSILQCSRCASVISMSVSRVNSRPSSQMSLMLDKKNCAKLVSGQEWEITCKICLLDCPQSQMVKIDDCGCMFCRECLKQYIIFEVMEGAYDISCPDPSCATQGVLSQTQMESLTDKHLMEKHRTFRLNTEVSLDANRTWCPSAGCDTICHICTGNKSQGVPVTCPTCVKEFCSLCSSTWHPGLSCAENGAALVRHQAGGEHVDVAMWIAAAEAENIKRCPMCGVPIERDAGCAQMMCKRCKHVFCWYCLTSLDDDFLLRHYDSGECQGKLGHSRLSVILHRAQVIGIFAGFTVLMLIASPLLLFAAPCLICCKCRTCVKTNEGATRKLEMATSAAKKSMKQ